MFLNSAEIFKKTMDNVQVAYAPSRFLSGYFGAEEVLTKLNEGIGLSAVRQAGQLQAAVSPLPAVSKMMDDILEASLTARKVYTAHVLDQIQLPTLPDLFATMDGVSRLSLGELWPVTQQWLEQLQPPRFTLSSILDLIQLDTEAIHSPQYRAIMQAYWDSLAVSGQDDWVAQDELHRLMSAYDALVWLEWRYREFIEQALRNVYADSWWEKLPASVRRECLGRQRGSSSALPPIQFLSVGKIPTILSAPTLWNNCFSVVVEPETDPAWVIELLNSVKELRNEVCHPRPLGDSDYKLFLLSIHFLQLVLERGTQDLTLN